MRIRWGAALVVICLWVAGCGAATDESATGSSTTTTSSAATSSGTSSPTPSDDPTPQSCVTQTLASLTPQQRAAQLIMVAQQPDSASAVQQAITEHQAASVILLGDWTSHEQVAAAVQQIDPLTPSTAGIGIWTSTDQEGGEVQKLSGPGFSNIPAVLTQGTLPLPDLTAQATVWAQELTSAGIDINLAPVADVVPDSIGKANDPIGQFNRQFGSTAAVVGPAVVAFAQGMQAGGVLPTAKHFPSIGRISANTDESAVGIDDPAMTANDPDLQPFIAAIQAKIPLVMVSSANYPQLDPASAAVFLAPIIIGLLRQQLGFGGIVITDDVGAAAAVAAVPVPERATRFIAAGGDVVLTAQPSQAAQMNAAIVARAAADPSFAAQVDAAVTRVLRQKDAGKLLPCSA